MQGNFSGKFILRSPAELHQRLVQEAYQKGMSLNQICLHFLSEGLDRLKNKEKSFDKYLWILKPLRKYFKEQLLGVILFGSQVTGEATPASDVDFLIVLSPSSPLSRASYRWWDQHIGESRHEGKILNPQFVHLPASPRKAGGLWFEVALAYSILWEKGKRISSSLKGIKKIIYNGEIRRFVSHGQPYWVWRNDEKQVAGH